MPSHPKTFYVYTLASITHRLYVGFTNNLERRMYEHKHKLLPGFTAGYNVNKLVYWEETNDPRVGIGREKQLKEWLRKKKIALIESANPKWQDLAAEWFVEPGELKKETSLIVRAVVFLRDASRSLPLRAPKGSA